MLNRSMQVPFFSYKYEFQILHHKIENAIEKVLKQGQLILGREVLKFEKDYAKYIGTEFGIGVNSGTDSIKIAIKSLNLKKNDEIITVANTAIPTISAIREAGVTPKLVDIKEDFTIDESKIEKVINKKTKVILSVHLYGQPCVMNKIMDIASRYQLKVIEDCCQAHGAQINNKKVGSFGTLSCFSFYPTKNLGACGDGGIILTSDKELNERCRMLRQYGTKKDYYSYIEGYNSRLDEIQAAILNIKLGYLDEWNQKRQKIAKHYLKNINNPKIFLPPVRNLKEHVFHLFVIRTNKRKN